MTRPEPLNTLSFETGGDTSPPGGDDGGDEGLGNSIVVQRLAGRLEGREGMEGINADPLHMCVCARGQGRGAKLSLMRRVGIIPSIPSIPSETTLSL